MADAKISALPIASITSSDLVPFSKMSSSVTSAVQFNEFFASPKITGHASIEGVGVSGATGSTLLVFRDNPTINNPSVIGDAEFARNITAGSLIAINKKVGGGLGYITGAGSAVGQLATKTASVVCNAMTGAITMNNSVMSASVITSFVVANSAMGINDFMLLQHIGGGTLGGYTFAQSTMGDTNTLIKVKNNTNAALSEAIVVGFVVIKGAQS